MVWNTVSQRTNSRHLRGLCRAASTAFFFGLALIVCAFVGVTATHAQQPEQDIFAATDALLASAEAIDASSLSPDTFSRGVKEYDKARAALGKGKSAESIEPSLAKARDYFRRSIENSETAASVLSDAIENRAAAQSAGAARLAPRIWEDGEKKFASAIRALEKDDIEAAGEFGIESSNLFGAAELDALRAQHFSEARRLIAEAEQKKVGKYASRTLGRAKSLLAEADTALANDRYQPDTAILLAGQASYEARHAIYLAELANDVKSGEQSIEDIVLDWEVPVTEIAGILDIDPDMTAGYTDTTKEITDSIRQLLTLNDEIAERDRLIAGLEDELRDMDVQFVGVSDERVALMRRLERQDRVREQFALVSTMFSPEEAQVLRDGDQLIIRLSGLSFASNSSKIGAESTALLEKVEAAIEVFPRCALTIEGHTDAQGNSGRNLELSIARAQSVMTFMNEEMRIPVYRMKSAGYGDSRPVSSNKTEEGRARNRRIDLIIVPNIDNL
jgi:OOP family OmpA-OmpF porin